MIARYVGLFSYDEATNTFRFPQKRDIVIARYVGLFSYDVTSIRAEDRSQLVIARYVGLFSYDDLSRYDKELPIEE